QPADGDPGDRGRDRPGRRDADGARDDAGAARPEMVAGAAHRPPSRPRGPAPDGAAEGTHGGDPGRGAGLSPGDAGDENGVEGAGSRHGAAGGGQPGEDGGD